MTTISSIISTLTSAFSTDWASASPAIPVFYDNQPDAVPPTGSPYVFFAVRNGASSYIGHSALTSGKAHGMVKQLGRVWLKVCVPKQSGHGAAMALVDQFIASMALRKFGAATEAFFTSSADCQPPIDENGMYVVNVSIPFEVSYNT